jgi:hypothetical protein
MKLLIYIKVEAIGFYSTATSRFFHLLKNNFFFFYFVISSNVFRASSKHSDKLFSPQLLRSGLSVSIMKKVRLITVVGYNN